MISWKLDWGVYLSVAYVCEPCQANKYVLTVHDIFGQNYEFMSMDHWSDIFFVKQTLAVLPVADWTVSFAFFLRHSQQ